MAGKYERVSPQKRVKSLPIVALLLTLAICSFIALLLSNNNSLTASKQRAGQKIGYAEAARLFEDEFNKFEDLIIGVGDTLTFLDNNTFETHDDIKAYEAKWQKLSNDASAISSKLTAIIPPEGYEEVWNSYAECMNQIATSLAKLTDLDPNHDGSYTSAEMSTFLNEVVSDFASLGNEALELAKKLNALSQTIETPSSQNPIEVEPEKQYIASDNYSYSYTDGVKHSDTEAWACALDIVKSNLTSPSTADFCSFTDAQIKSLGGGEYLVVGWVDAQNIFGAVVRKNFAVTYSATKDGYKNGEVIFY